jgi:PleD family two-component response regulator
MCHYNHNVVRALQNATEKPCERVLTDAMIQNEGPVMRKPTRVLIVDDNVHARQGLRTFLATWPEITIVVKQRTGRTACDWLGNADRMLC